MLGVVGGDEPRTTTPLLFRSILRITKNSTATSATSATAPTPTPALAPVDRPLVDASLIGAAASVLLLLAAPVVVVAVTLLVAELTPVALELKLADLLAVTVVVGPVAVKKYFACVAFPSFAATKSLAGQPAALVQALLAQQPMNGVLSVEHVYQLAALLAQSCGRMPW